jgi:AcrR family transcriptional regulator
MSRKSEVPARVAHAAAALFSRQGYHGTTTREIARLADVSEVTIFRYFEHKEDIFASALSSSFSVIKPRLDLFKKISKGEAPEAVLPKILSLLVDAAAFSPELVRLIAVAFLEVGGGAEVLCREHLAPFFRSISDYLEANIENGRIRNLDPMLMTTAMVLTTFAQPEISALIKGNPSSKLDSRNAIEEYIDFWLRALMLPAPGTLLAMPARKLAGN